MGQVWSRIVKGQTQEKNDITCGFKKNTADEVGKGEGVEMHKSGLSERREKLQGHGHSRSGTRD